MPRWAPARIHFVQAQCAWAWAWLVVALVVGAPWSSTGALVQVVRECSEDVLHRAAASGGILRFDCDGEIKITRTIVARNNLIIDGGGRSITISGDGSLRVFEVAPKANLVLRRLTVADGRGDGGGGALVNYRGVVTAERVTFRNNAARGRNGGNSQNGTSGVGGAIYNIGVLRLRDCVFEQNRTEGGMGAEEPWHSWNAIGPAGGSAAGGAILNERHLRAARCLFRTNFVTGGLGGYGLPLAGTLVIQPSDVAGPVPSSFGTIGIGVTSVIIFGPIGDRRVPGGPGGYAYGGAIASLGGSLRLSDCRFEGNWAEGGQGGDERIFFGSGGTGSVAPTNRGGNGGHALGGAVWSRDTAALFERSGFVGNRCIGGRGGDGAVNPIGAESVLPATGGVGGVAAGAGFTAVGGRASIVNTTIGLNSAQAGDGGRGGQWNEFGGSGGAGGIAPGGAIHLRSNVVQITHATVASNHVVAGVGGAGGGLDLAGVVSGPTGEHGSVFIGGIYGQDAMVSLRANILANEGGNLLDGLGEDLGFNLSTDASINLTAPTSRVMVDPMLQAMEDADGTPVFPVTYESPAANVVERKGLPPTDQRGVRRRRAGLGDVGAYESTPVSSRGLH